MKNIISKIPRWIHVALISGVVVYLIANKIRKSIIYNKIIEEGTGSKKDETLNVSKLTITETQAQNIADTIYKALRPYVFGWGTDEQAIINALTGLNANDILLVEQKFGIRDGMNMKAYIKDDISSTEKAYSQIAGIYQSVGLTF